MMKIRYTVTAIPKDPVKTEKVYKDVYDIGHYYGRNVPDACETLRLLLYREDGKDRHEYINLMKNDVLIHLEE